MTRLEIMNIEVADAGGRCGRYNGEDLGQVRLRGRASCFEVRAQVASQAVTKACGTLEVCSNRGRRVHWASRCLQLPQGGQTARRGTELACKFQDCPLEDEGLRLPYSRPAGLVWRVQVQAQVRGAPTARALAATRSSGDGRTIRTRNRDGQPWSQL